MVQIGQLWIQGLTQKNYFGNPRFFGQVVNKTGKATGARIQTTFWKDEVVLQDRSTGPLGYVELGPGEAAAFDVLLPEQWDRYQISADLTPTDQFAKQPGLTVISDELNTTPAGGRELTGEVKNNGSEPETRLLLILTAVDAAHSVVCAATV